MTCPRNSEWMKEIVTCVEVIVNVDERDCDCVEVIVHVDERDYDLSGSNCACGYGLRDDCACGYGLRNCKGISHRNHYKE